MTRIMIVDDHPTMVWGLEQLIATQSPRMQVVATARSADEALNQAQAFRPDVVLLDLDLGGLRSGLDILPVLSRQQDCQVLVLTGQRKTQTLDQAVQLGARGVLRKDVSAETVIKAIDKVHSGEVWLDRTSMARMLNGLRQRADRDPEQARRATLTQREKKIIQVILAGHGAGNKVLATRLFISEHTLRNHLSSIYHKLGVSNRLELYVYAMAHRLGDDDPISGNLFD
jgi:two-component system, NarL family, nitrate/nitrite response regulator NarL